MFKPKPREKLYIAVDDDGSNFLIVSSAKSREIWERYGIKENCKYYEFDTSKLIEVNMRLIVENK